MANCRICNKEVIWDGVCSDCTRQKLLGSDENKKSLCSGCEKYVERLFECYVSNNIKYRCLLCFEELRRTKKTFSTKYKTRAEMKYGSHWQAAKNKVGITHTDPFTGITTFSRVEQKEAEDLVAIKAANMGGVRLLTHYFPKGNNASAKYPMVFVFQVLSIIQTSTFEGRTNESVEVNTNLFYDNGAKALSGTIRLSEPTIIADIRREFKNGMAIGAVGFYIVDSLKDDGSPIISSIWSYNDPGEKFSRNDLINNGYKHLAANGIDWDDLNRKMNDLGIKAYPRKWGLCCYSRFNTELIKKFIEKGGELVFTAEPITKLDEGEDEIPF